MGWTTRFDGGTKSAMAIPTYDVLMLPVLRLSAERPWSMRELIARIADGLVCSGQ